LAEEGYWGVISSPRGGAELLPNDQKAHAIEGGRSWKGETVEKLNSKKLITKDSESAQTLPEDLEQSKKRQEDVKKRYP